MILYAVFCLLIQVNLYARDIPISILSADYVNSLTVIKSNIDHPGKNAAISIISDGIEMYLLKQVKDDSFYAQLSLIKEVIVSAVASLHNINLDKNSFIPYNVGQNIKIYKNRAATLHAFIQGNDLETKKPSFLSKDFRLSQRFRPYAYEYKHGFEVEYGFNPITLKSMACHKDLPPIVAIDTFFGNFDRDMDNLFYDEKTNSFYGIDQGAAFSGDLPFLSIFAYHQIVKLKEQDYFMTCSLDVMLSLVLYQAQLDSLCKKNQPLDIILCFEQLIPFLQAAQYPVEQSNYIKNLFLYLKQTHQICSDIVLTLQEIIFNHSLRI